MRAGRRGESGIGARGEGKLRRGDYGEEYLGVEYELAMNRFGWLDRSHLLPSSTHYGTVHGDRKFLTNPAYLQILVLRLKCHDP